MAIRQHFLTILVFVAAFSCADKREIREKERCDFNRTEVRHVLLDDVFGVPFIPSIFPTSVSETNADIPAALNTDAVRFAQEIVLETAEGVDSRMLFLFPRISPRALVIYHEGHHPHGFQLNGADTVNTLVHEGYAVLGINMPFYGGNSNPFPTANHEHLFQFPRPLRFFMEPITAGINYITGEHGLDDVRVVGL